jgi:hypothetical protein
MGFGFEVMSLIGVASSFAGNCFCVVSVALG